MTDVRLSRRTNALFKYSTNAHPDLVPEFVSKPIQGDLSIMWTGSFSRALKSSKATRIIISMF